MVPPYDPDLPITAWHDEIARTIREHPVVVVAGETGSGKTTQLPKICLELGRRSIGHTQPRRIAARTVAERVAAELGTELGDLVGYQVRFARQSSTATRLKVMTDGVLLAEIARDRDLRRYDTIILDEAHERSLNIDFLLGYLRRLLPRRPDLKVLVTSATIDTERFAAHFAGPDGTPAPVIEVSGRTYPVEVRYRPPPVVAGEVDQVAAVLDAVAELRSVGDGDILVFLSGEREIRDLAEALRGARLPRTEVLPLYARLSSRRAAPGLRAARRPPDRAGHQRGRDLVDRAGYPVRHRPGHRPDLALLGADEGAAAADRADLPGLRRAAGRPVRPGRPGRVHPAVQRGGPAQPAGVHRAGDPADQPGVGDPADGRRPARGDRRLPLRRAPDRSQVADGLRLLTELGALADPGERRRTPADRRGPAAGRAAGGPAAGPDAGRGGAPGLPAGDAHRRLRPVHRRPAGTAGRCAGAGGRPAPAVLDAARRSSDDDAATPAISDFLAWLHLWDYLRTQRKALSGSAFRRLCRDEYLHFLRVREWQDLHGQLKQIVGELDMTRNDVPAPPDRVHTAALAGLLSQVGLADVREPARPSRRRSSAPTRSAGVPRGPRAPGSPSAPAPAWPGRRRPWWSPPSWSRPAGSGRARSPAITAEQVEEVGQHLLKRQYSEPHWSARSGSVLAYETVSLLGVPIVARRRVGYGKINPVEAREIFLRSALVEGQWRTRHPFFAANQALRAEVEALEERTRRRDLLVDDETVLAFYAARVPDGIVSAAHFDAWWKRARPGDTPTC